MSYSSYDDFICQAEDGIQYYKVTGVQTCALPISLRTPRDVGADHKDAVLDRPSDVNVPGVGDQLRSPLCRREPVVRGHEIGRASCRKRVGSMMGDAE